MSRRNEDFERRLRALELRVAYSSPELLATAVATAMTNVARFSDVVNYVGVDYERALKRLAELLRYGEERGWRGALRPPEPI